MYLRIINGKLKPGTWDAFEKAYRDVVGEAGAVPGLRARWLTRDVDNPDAGTTISLWESEAAMDAYENSDVLKNKINATLSPYFAGEYRTSKTRVQFADGVPPPSEWTK
ncbi:MAG: antibiotic biosynthesis monooxygenase [Beijerinckiaceae bacterium]